MSFDCANLLFTKRHPPFCTGERMNVVDAAVERLSFAKRHPPLLDLQGATNFFARDFVFRLWHKRILLALESSLVKDLTAFERVRIFFVFEFFALGYSLATASLP